MLPLTRSQASMNPSGLQLLLLATGGGSADRHRPGRFASLCRFSLMLQWCRADVTRACRHWSAPAEAGSAWCQGLHHGSWSAASPGDPAGAAPGGQRAGDKGPRGAEVAEVHRGQDAAGHRYAGEQPRNPRRVRPPRPGLRPRFSWLRPSASECALF